MWDLVTLVLGIDEPVAHLGIPVVPGGAAHVVHDLGGIVAVVHGAGLRAPLLQSIDAGEEAGISGAPAEVLAAEQADGGGVLAFAAAAVAVTAAVRCAGVIEPLVARLEGADRDIEAGHLAGLETHQLPAAHGRIVASLA